MSSPQTKVFETQRLSSFLFLYDNMNIVMIFDSFLKGEQSSGSFTPPRMSLAQTKPKAVELLRKSIYDFMIVDQACLGTSDPQEWLSSLSKEIQGGSTVSNQLKVFLLGNSNLSTEDIEKFIKAGYDDVFFKPIDMPIIAQKINNITNVVFSSQNQLYFAPLTSSVKVAYRYHLEGLSEAGCRLLLDQELSEGDVFSMIIPEFEPFGIRELLAKIISCREHPNHPKKYIANINFVGLQPHVTKTIRRWIMEEYVKAK